MVPSRERDRYPSPNLVKISTAKHNLAQDAAIHRCNGDYPGTRLLSAVGHVIAASVPHDAKFQSEKGRAVNLSRCPLGSRRGLCSWSALALRERLKDLADRRLAGAKLILSAKCRISAVDQSRQSARVNDCCRYGLPTFAAPVTKG